MNVAILYMDDDFSIQKVENKLVPAEAKELIYEDEMYIEDERIDFDKDFLKIFISNEKIEDSSFLQDRNRKKKLLQLRGFKSRAIKRRNRASEWAYQRF